MNGSDGGRAYTDVDIENQISSDDGLASRLKKGTEQAHEEAENVAFVKLLLKGKAPLESYVALIAALKPIYGALEKAADRVSRTCPAVARVCDDTLPQLRRYESLEADLTYYRRRCPDVTKRAEAFARRSKATNEYVSSLIAGRPRARRPKPWWPICTRGTSATCREARFCEGPPSGRMD